MAIGEDAVNSTAELLNKIFQILIEIIRMRNERVHYGDTSKGNKQPKITYGEMKTSEYKKMLKDGEKMRTVQIPADKLEILKKYSKQVGARYWLLESDGNNATAVVPESGYAQFNDAVKLTVKEQLSNNASSLTVKDGTEIIPENDIDLVRTVLDYHDIPAYSFRNSDGSYMNIVPSEFDGQYRAAMEEVGQLKAEMNNIDISSFEQTVPSYEFTDIIEEISEDKAEYIKSAMPDGAIDFLKDENGKTYLSYPEFTAGTAEKVNNCAAKYAEEVRAADDYKISVIDNTVSINEKALLISENENEYFTKVPNTGGQDYIKIAKSDALAANGTITAKIDYQKMYQIYDKDGILKSERSGRELAGNYNKKSPNADKDTKAVHYHDDTLERVELYNSKENKLISIGMDSAEKMRADLSEQGITGQTAEKILSEINKALPDEYKEKFAYAPEKKNIEYGEIKSDFVEQYKLYEKIKNSGGEAMEFDSGIGNKCCVFDKNTNKYILVNANEDNLRDGLAEMGYDRLHINAIVSEVQKSYSKSGALLEREDVQVKSFETTNAEASKCGYIADSSGITLIKQNQGGGNGSVKYIQFGQDASRSDIENAVLSGLEIKDTASAAAIMSCLDEKELIAPPHISKTKDGFEVAKITSDYVSVGRDGEKMTLCKDNINAAKISDKFGVSERSAEHLKKIIEKSLKSYDKQKAPQSYKEIRAAAKNAFEKNKSKEKSAQAVTSERSK